jgi:hypothetical protein
LSIPFQNFFGEPGRRLDKPVFLPYNRQVNHPKEDDMKRFHNSRFPFSVFRSLFFYLLFFSLAPLLLCSPAVVFSQQRWTRTYGGTGWEQGSFVQQTTDGGYIVVGYTESFGAGGGDIYFIKTNASGDTLWTKTYGGTSSDLGWSVRQTTDGGYIVAGYTESFGAGFYDVYLIKTNATGDTLWTRTYGGTGYDFVYSVQQTTDGGYILAGYTNSFGHGAEDVYLIKTNATGDTLWTKTYGGTNNDKGYYVQQTNDGGYIIIGTTWSFRDTLKGDVYLIKTNAGGDTLWTRTYGGTDYEDGSSVQQTTDGAYIAVGTTFSSGDTLGDVYLIKANANGDTLWTRIYGGAKFDYGSFVQQTADGGYIIAGGTKSYGAGNDDSYLIKTNAFGDTLWTRTYGGAANDYGYCVQRTIDGGYIIVGETFSFGDSVQVYLIKTDSLGNVGVEENRQGAKGPRRQGVTAKPNPFISFARVPGHEAERFSLYDISGRLVGTCKGDRVGEGLGAGVYFLRAEKGKDKPVRIVKVR